MEAAVPAVMETEPGLPSQAQPAVGRYRCESGSGGCASAAAVPHVRSCSKLGSRAETLCKGSSELHHKLLQ